MPRTPDNQENNFFPPHRPHNRLWLVLLILLIFLCYPLIVTSAGNNLSRPTGTDPEQSLTTGILRVLHANNQSAGLSRVERDMLLRFAKAQQLDLKWIKVDARWNLLPRLLAGEGDMIIGEGQSLMAGMSGPVEFTSPWTASGLQIVARPDTSRIENLTDLAGRQIALKASSAAWPVLEEISAKHPTLDLVAVPESLTQGDILRRVASGVYEMTVVDSHTLVAYLPRYPALASVYDLTRKETRSWGVHASAVELQSVLNQFLYKHHLSLSVDDIHLSDLPEMQARRTLRVITYQSPAHYYFRDGGFHGFEYELINRFAREQDMRVDVVLADSHAEMQSLLLRGEGDVIAASLPNGSIVQTGIATSGAYNYSAPVIIGREGGRPITDIRDLEGRRVTLPASSPYRQQLERIQSRGIRFEIAEADSSISIKGVLSMVSLGMFDLTLLDNQQLKPELIRDFRVKAHFSLGAPVPHVWAVRAENSRLLASINDFLETTYRNKFYNLLYSKYFDNSDLSLADIRLITQEDDLSPYDEIVRRYAEDYSFDWRLITAQMYQESQFNPAAVSDVGAEGLMQLMPSTAEFVGNEDLADPEKNIAAGVKYLSILRDRFEKDLLLEDRSWFTLASYNAGYGRVNQARKLAVQMGLDKDRWFGNVEKAMLAMAEPVKRDGETVHRCRCGQTVVYVREIRSLYNNYVRLTQSARIASTTRFSSPPYDI